MLTHERTIVIGPFQDHGLAQKIAEADLVAFGIDAGKGRRRAADDRLGHGGRGLSKHHAAQNRYGKEGRKAAARKSFHW